MIIKLKPTSYEDRNHLVIALANAGYKTWVAEVPHEDGVYLHTRILVCFEYENGGGDGAEMG